MAGKNATVKLVGFGPVGSDFRGFLIDASSGVLGDGSEGKPYTPEGQKEPCGWGHTESGVKISVSWTYTPDAGAKIVTFSGFVVAKVDEWYELSSTVPIAA